MSVNGIDAKRFASFLLLLIFTPTEIELIKNQITSAIEQVTMNGVNLKSLGIPKAALDDNNDLSSENGLLKEYKRLLVVLKQLQILKKRTIDQIDSSKREILELEQEIGKYSNLNVKLQFITFFIIKNYFNNGEKKD